MNLAEHRFLGSFVGPAFAAALLGLAGGAAAEPQGPLADARRAELLSQPSAQGVLELYRDYTRYPPESRPLDASQWDLLHPWSVDAPALAMMPRPLLERAEALHAAGVADVAQSLTLPAGLPHYQFELNKVILAGTADELVARLSVTRPVEGATSMLLRSGVHLPLQLVKAELLGDPRFGAASLGAPATACDADGMVCTFRWKAPAAQRQYWGQLTLQVTARVPGNADELLARQSFYSSPITAGRFTGGFAERIEHGSLVVDAGVQVQKRLLCFVSANLYSVDRAVPTHHFEQRMIVDPAMKSIPLGFYGKVFRDYGHEGAFRVQDLQARCQNLPYPAEWAYDSSAHAADLEKFWRGPQPAAEPARIYFEYNDYAYTTGRYANAVFSDAEWSAPEKSRKLEIYRQAARELSDPALAARKQKLVEELRNAQ